MVDLNSELDVSRPATGVSATLSSFFRTSICHVSNFSVDVEKKKESTTGFTNGFRTRPKIDDVGWTTSLINCFGRKRRKNGAEKSTGREVTWEKNENRSKAKEELFATNFFTRLMSSSFLLGQKTNQLKLARRATNSKVFSNLAHSSCGGQSISWDFVIGKLICNNLRSKVDVHANCWVPHRSAAGPLMFHTYIGVCYSTT